MRIDEIHLKNFKNFEDKIFRLNPHFTVAIGENGSGKSSLIDALCVAAGGYLSGYKDLQPNDKRNIDFNEIRRRKEEETFPADYPCVVTAHGEIQVGKRISWERAVSSAGGKTTRVNAKDITEYASDLEYRLQNGEYSVDLPVLAYFGTGRLHVKASYSGELVGSRISVGYRRCLDRAYLPDAPMQWLRKYYLAKLESEKDPDKIPDAELFDAVAQTIEACVPNWRSLKWASSDSDHDELIGLVSQPGKADAWCPLSYLSDGLRSMAHLTAELAFRCVTLNPHLGADAVKKSKGIVLIDEIDLHLHPKWQRTIVNDLKEAFPGLQFVATTHSPFIVQSLEADELINLDSDEEPRDYSNFSLERVAQQVMGVSSSDSSFQEQQQELLQQFEELISKVQSTASLTLEETRDAERKLKVLLSEIDNPVFKALGQQHLVELKMKLSR